MRLLFVGCVLVVLNGCLGSNTKGQDEFYTWVDERGQVRTVQKNPKQTSKGQETAQSEGRKKGRASDFDPSDFQSEEVVQARLKDTKLYAWTSEGGRQEVIEEALVGEKPAQKPQFSLESSVTQSGYLMFREGHFFPWLDVLSKEIKLSDYYRYNQSAQRDYLLIDLLDMPKSSSLLVKSFITKSSVALPQFVFLDNKFNPLSSDVVPLQYYTPESWHSYGYLSGMLNAAEGAHYLLVYTSDINEALVFDGNAIKVSDLGRIVIEPQP